jgi:hypothetical protein
MEAFRSTTAECIDYWETMVEGCKLMEIKEKTVSIGFTRDEALVLFEWLARLDDAPNKPQIDDAEQKVVWSLESKLEQLLAEIVEPEYKKLLAEAKARLMS